ncbi:D-alanyl-D-alanine carboxypeptidase/D-alanyl-D-alanine-endopeptidase [Flagellimonas zhangzhouensis]|uniref:D-alanyl-D-alanine carboxypeptidase / D-alanyl-D-alanine-endopeptidase (Penicillin-binding protein 4) n=1 Tax=Flagellimonas zhangzhouensis TaxID=1073328 RepID=A0A1H2RJ06_9FLAO|nr:D-alanyl-D-alanine carboxypeptidase [Allomuricauda zhangzhouensis]SDQ64552.1 D-alanyl-D-alanine carboxypeptidase / D-alanyl-D-alanine-endopeptidase (penicillin-binding protein 4) [Allomuricauda zhangzhouensis]SDW19463.1 D-alanyl-D-alanine carboxypeptidase / D-alanyl-D-alanine-endopeptidase (penicillin-binding protein 4) [Allomuricauda zhangzhouensis]
MNKKNKPKYNNLIFSSFTCFFLLASCVSTKKTLNSRLTSEGLNNSFHGLVVVDAKTEKEVFNHNGDKYFTPASNTKIVTLYSAIKLLPKNIPTLIYVVQNDTLFIKGTGDPSWLHPYLMDSTAVKWLKNQNTIALYTNNHNEDRFGPGWAWEDYDTYFSPEKTTLPLYGNVVTISNSDSLGLKVSPSFFKNQTEIKEAPFKRDELGNHFYIDPTEKDTLEVPFITSDSLMQHLLSSVLDKDIALTDHFPSGEQQILFGMETDSILKRMLLKSDNFLAEQLLLTASSTLSDTLSTKTAINFMLDNHLGDLDQQPRWVDGSGLSRYNLFTPRSFVQILQKLYAEVPEERLFNLIPMWGPDSTVETWEDATTEPFLLAKSGSVGNNYNLSGYIKTKSGKLLIFSFMNNHFRVPSIEIRRNMYETLKGLYENY